MRLHQIGLIASLATVGTLLACKDSAPSGPLSAGEQSGTLSGPVFAKLPPGCKRVRGDVDLTLIPSPNDPLGRSIGPSGGGLKGAVTSVITSLVPQGGDVILATTLETWVGGLTDILNASANVTYTQIGSTFDFTVDATQTIVSGTGKYSGATGTIHVTGIGHDLFGPNAGPGSTNFELEYDGTVCTT